MVTRRAVNLHLWVVVAIVGAAFLLAQVPAQAATTWPPTLPFPQAKWTVMVYMAADNDLEPFAALDINEMEMAPDGGAYDPVTKVTTPDVNVVVCLDTMSATTHFFRIVHDDNPTSVGSDKADKPLTTTDQGELNTGDPNTLISFAAWAETNYPAEKYALIVWDHGGGWRATADLPMKDIAYDYTDLSYMSTSGMAAALASIAGGNKASPSHITVFGMDACLMGMLEVGYAVKDYADYMVASEELVPGTGLAYDGFVTGLRAEPTMVPDQLARLIARTYVNSYSGGTQGFDAAQMAAIDLARVDAVKAATNAFASEVLTAIKNDASGTFPARVYGWWGLSGIVSEATYTGMYGLPQVETIDLGTFAQAASMEGGYPTVAAAASAVLNAVDSAVLYTGVSSIGSTQTYPEGLYKGLSIYYPCNLMPDPAYIGTAFIGNDDDLPWYLLVSTAPLSLGTVQDPYEDDSTAATANTPTMGIREPFHWFDYSDDSDVFRFTLADDQVCVVRTVDVGPLSDTRIYIYDPDFSLVGTSDDTGFFSFFGGTQSEFQFTAAKSGTYYAVVVQCDQGIYANSYGTPTYYSFLVSPVNYIDVSPSSASFLAIEQCTQAGIVTGFSGGYYLPKLPVRRDAMAVFIARAMAGGDDNVPEVTSAPSFPDIPADNWAYKYVAYVRNAGVVKGYPDGQYHPEYPVNRGLMALFIARAVAGGEANVPVGPTGSMYFDIAQGNPAYNHISYLDSLGVVKGYSDNRYHPERVVTREQMASYIARAFLKQ